MMKNKIIIKCIIIFILLFVAVMQTIDYFKDNSKDKINEQSSEKLDSESDPNYYVVGDLEFYAKSYVYNPNTNTSGFVFNIKNISKETFELERFKVIIKDRNGNKLAESNNEIIVDLNYNESVDYSIKLDGNVFDDGKFKLEFIPNYEL